MFLGEYTHTIDTKRRLSIPNRLRKGLSEALVLTKGPDGCLFLYPQSAWQKMAEKLSQLPLGQADVRNFVRFMLAGAAECETDALGRIIIPDHLKTYAGISNKAVIVGVFDRIEIWSPDTWNEMSNRTEQNVDRLAEQLGELGMY